MAEKTKRALKRIIEPSPRNPNCDRCGLCHEMRHNVCVWGSGPQTSDIMLVGIMPGFEEDKQGKPWVGDAGEYLRDRLEGLGIDLDSLYATNLLKCTTPRDRVAGGFQKPTASEIKMCAPYLVYEVNKFKPKVIVAMGDIPIQFFTGQTGVGASRGGEVVLHRAGFTVIPTYNPAYFVRNTAYAIASGQEDRFLADLQKAKAIAEGKQRYTQVEVAVADTAAKVKEMFAGMEAAKEVVVDIETTGLEDYREWSRVYCIGVCFEDGHAWVVPWDHPDHPKANGAIRKRFIELLHGKTVIGHNVKFDLRWLARLHGLDIWKVKGFWDTRVASHLLDDNYPPGHKLKTLVRDEVGAPNYAFGMRWGGDAVRSFMVGKKKIAWEDLLKYCGMDAGYTWLLKQRQAEALAEEPDLEAMAETILFPSSRAFCQMELNGIGIDEQRLVDSRKEIKKDIAQLQEELKAEGLDVGSMSKKAVVIEWVYGARGHPVTDRTPRTREPAVGRDTLLKYALTDPAIGKLLECQKLMKMKSGYVGDPDHPDKKKRSTGWLPLIHDGRLYARYDLAGTVTGRTSCEAPNMQQVDRDSRIRSIVAAPPGWSLLHVDFSQIEMRIAAVIARDEGLIAAYNANIDVHRRAAARALGKQMEEVTDEERTKAKARNFGFLFGMKWPTYQRYAFRNYGLVLGDEESKQEEAFFHKEMPGISRWQRDTAIGIRQQALQALAERRGEEYVPIDTSRIRVYAYHERWQCPVVISPLGRVRRLPRALSGDSREAESACRMAMNSPVQSPASDFAQWAQARVYDSEVLRELGFDPPSEHGILKLDEIRVVLFGHDSIMSEVRDDCVDKYAAIIKAVMENLPLSEMGVGYWPIPLKADVSVYKHWGEHIEEEGPPTEEGEDIE